MGWWKNWKARNWDEVHIPARVEGGIVFRASRKETPPLRNFARRAAQEWANSPIQVSIAIALFLGAVISGLLAWIL